MDLLYSILVFLFGIIVAFAALYVGIFIFLTKKVEQHRLYLPPSLLSESIHTSNESDYQMPMTQTRPFTADLGESLKRGNMKVRGSFKVWQNRYFDLHPGKLIYYGNHKSKKVWGIVKLQGCQVHRQDKKHGPGVKIWHPDDKCIYSSKGLQGETLISAKFPGSSSQIELCLSSIKERDEWYTNLKLAIESKHEPMKDPSEFYVDDNIHSELLKSDPYDIREFQEEVANSPRKFIQDDLDINIMPPLNTSSRKQDRSDSSHRLRPLLKKQSLPVTTSSTSSISSLSHNPLNPNQTSLNNPANASNTATLPSPNLPPNMNNNSSLGSTLTGRAAVSSPTAAIIGPHTNLNVQLQVQAQGVSPPATPPIQNLYSNSDGTNASNHGSGGSTLSGGLPSNMQATNTPITATHTFAGVSGINSSRNTSSPAVSPQKQRPGGENRRSSITNSHQTLHQSNSLQYTLSGPLPVYSGGVSSQSTNSPAILPKNKMKNKNKNKEKEKEKDKDKDKDKEKGQDKDKDKDKDKEKDKHKNKGNQNLPPLNNGNDDAVVEKGLLPNEPKPSPGSPNITPLPTISNVNNNNGQLNNNGVRYGNVITDEMKDYYDGYVEIKDASGKFLKKWIVLRKGLFAIFHNETSGDCSDLIDLTGCELRFPQSETLKKKSPQKSPSRKVDPDAASKPVDHKTETLRSDGFKPDSLRIERSDINEKTDKNLSSKPGKHEKVAKIEKKDKKDKDKKDKHKKESQLSEPKQLLNGDDSEHIYSSSLERDTDPQDSLPFQLTPRLLPSPSQSPSTNEPTLPPHPIDITSDDPDTHWSPNSLALLGPGSSSCTQLPTVSKNMVNALLTESNDLEPVNDQLVSRTNSWDSNDDEKLREAQFENERVIRKKPTCYSEVLIVDPVDPVNELLEVEDDSSNPTGCEDDVSDPSEEMELDDEEEEITTEESSAIVEYSTDSPTFTRKSKKSVQKELKRQKKKLNKEEKEQRKREKEQKKKEEKEKKKEEEARRKEEDENIRKREEKEVRKREKELRKEEEREKLKREKVERDRKREEEGRLKLLREEEERQARKLLKQERTNKKKKDELTGSSLRKRDNKEKDKEKDKDKKKDSKKLKKDNLHSSGANFSSPEDKLHMSKTPRNFDTDIYDEDEADNVHVAEDSSLPSDDQNSGPPPELSEEDEWRSVFLIGRSHPSEKKLFFQLPRKKKERSVFDEASDWLCIRTDVVDYEWWARNFNECIPKDDEISPIRLPDHIRSMFHSQPSPEKCEWLNAFAARYFCDMKKSTLFVEKLMVIMSKQIAKINPKRPSFLGEFTVVNVTPGHDSVHFESVRMMDSTRTPGELVGEMKLTYKGSASVTIASEVYINWPTNKFATVPVMLSVTLDNLSGTLQVYGPKENFSRFSASFVNIDEPEFNANIVLGEKLQISKYFPQIKQFIINQLKKILWKNTCTPNKITFSLPLPGVKLALKTIKYTSRRSRTRREHERALLSNAGIPLNNPGSV